MAKSKKKQGIHSTAFMIGCFRVQLGEKDESGKTRIVGDSGWKKNQIVNLGWQDYIMASIGGVSGSKQITHMGIGTGTAPASNGTSLQGETGTRKTTNNTTVASHTLRCTASWASDDHPGGTPNIRNLGLFNTSSGGTLCCGQTFSSSAWNSNQAVSVTYELRTG